MKLIKQVLKEGRVWLSLQTLLQKEISADEIKNGEKEELYEIHWTAYCRYCGNGQNYLSKEDIKILLTGTSIQIECIECEQIYEFSHDQVEGHVYINLSKFPEYALLRAKKKKMLLKG